MPYRRRPTCPSRAPRSTRPPPVRGVEAVMASSMLEPLPRARGGGMGHHAAWRGGQTRDSVPNGIARHKLESSVLQSKPTRDERFRFDKALQRPRSSASEEPPLGEVGPDGARWNGDRRCAHGGFGRLPRGPARYKLDWRVGASAADCARLFNCAAAPPFGAGRQVRLSLDFRASADCHTFQHMPASPRSHGNGVIKVDADCTTSSAI